MIHTQPHDWRWRLEQQDANCLKTCRPFEHLYIKAMATPLAGIAAVEPPPTHMVQCCPSGSVFVKEYDYFVSQKGHIDGWGRNWKPVWADSLEEARKQACTMFPNARPYERQA